MHLVAIAWGYVVLMMAVAEAINPNGTVLGAVITFLLYGVLPLSIVMYILGTPMRRRARLAAEAKAQACDAASASPVQPDGGDHAAGNTVAAERIEP
jgi:hypothetical protein